MLEEDARQDRERMRACERWLTDETLEEDGPERENIDRRREHRVAARLLGRHVIGRSQRVADLREIARRRDANDSEVQNLHARYRPVDEEEIRGLDVAMQDAARVCADEGRGDAVREEQRLVDRKRSAEKAREEILALEIFHREITGAIRRRPMADVSNDTRGLEGREHF